MFRLEFLRETKDTAGLIAVLRCACSTEQRRADAALALGTLEDTELVETLICAYKADPAEAVQQAALAALEDLLGAEARLAVAAYPVSPGELDHWLVETPYENDVLAILAERKDPQIDFLLKDAGKRGQIKANDPFDLLGGDGTDAARQTKSAKSLVQTLRSSKVSPQKRALAALTLGTRFRREETETLVRALVEDPESIVQEAARSALAAMYGNQAEQVIASYRHAFPYEEDWLLKGSWQDDEVLDTYDDTALTDFAEANPRPIELDSVDFQGLIALLKGDSRLDLRLKAVSLLQYSTDARAIEWLLLTATQDDEPQVRETARQVLADLFPDDYENMLLTFSEEGEDYQPGEEMDAEADDAEMGWEEPADKHPRQLSNDQVPAVVEKNDLLPLIIGAGLLLAAVIIVFYLLVK